MRTSNSSVLLGKDSNYQHLYVFQIPYPLSVHTPHISPNNLLNIPDNPSTTPSIGVVPLVPVDTVFKVS